MNPINEAYIGKTGPLLEIERQIGRFRSKYMGQIIGKDECNEDIELIKLNRMFEKFTGFTPFCLGITTENVFNAFTYPVGARFDITTDLSKDIKVSNKEVKMDPKKEYCLITFIYSGLIFNPKFTDGEILAILLHEIGHNFGGGVIPQLGCLDLMYKVQTFICTCLTFGIGGLTGSNYGVKLAKKFKDEMMSNKFIRDITRTFVNFRSIVHFINQTIEAFASVINVLDISLVFRYVQYVAQECLFNPVRILQRILGYSSENFADQYATMYGYGPELTSALNKMHFNNPSEVKQAIQEIPILGALYGIQEILFHIIISPIEPHPLTPRRLKLVLETLEEELKDTKLDPKAKKRILNDIKRLKEQAEEYNKASKNCADANSIRKLYYGFVYEYLGGDIKHFIFTASNAENFKNRIDSLNPMKKINLK